MKYLMNTSPSNLEIELKEIKINKELTECVEILMRDYEIGMNANLDKNNAIELRDLLTELINKMKDNKNNEKE
jgi:hypothetical protein